MFKCYTKSIHLLACSVLVLSNGCVQAEVALASKNSAVRVWSGQLEVQTQSGTGCNASQVVPYKLPIHLTIERTASGGDQVFVWGAMQPATLVPKEVLNDERRTFSIHFLPLNEADHGAVTFLLEGKALDGSWAETPNNAGKNACMFTQARMHAIELSSVDAQPLAEFSHNAQLIYQLINAQSRDAIWSVKDLQTLLQHGERLVANPLANTAIAQAYLDVGESLWLQNRKTEAAQVMRLANRIYATNADGQFEYVALGLGREASLLRSMRRANDASQLYMQAQKLLLTNGKTQSAAAAILHNNYASLLLLQGNYKGALQEYTRAFEVDELRGAGATELALSMVNLGETFASMGQSDAAVRLLQQGLDRLVKVGKQDSDIGKLIKSRLTDLEVHRLERAGTNA